MNYEIEKKIGENIKALRIKANFSQEKLSAKLQLEGCDLTRSAIAKIEVAQRHIYPDEIIAIAKVLSADYNDILNIK